MLDLKLIRSDPERVKAALARRGAAERGRRAARASTPAGASCCPRSRAPRPSARPLSKQIGEAKQRGEDAEEPMRAVAGA